MSNFNYNNVQLGCRLTGDPILRTTPNGVNVASFSVAINTRKNGEQQAEFFNVVAWRNVADFVAKYFKKGSSAFITGELHNRKWKDQNGTEHYGIEILATNVHFVDSRDSGAPEPQLAPLDPEEPLPFN